MYPVSGRSLKLVAVTACCFSVLAGERTYGQVLRGEAAFGGWREDRPGVRRLLTAQDLPPISTATFGSAQMVPVPAGGRPQVPVGIAVARDGSLFVTEDGNGTIWRVTYRGSARAR
jgi:glucose/arabinose dehydrogenase